MTQRILIMGLPGAGKTILAQRVSECLQNAHKTTTWINADRVREEYLDWDFSVEGRLRQSIRMRDLADASNTDYAVCDFVCPLPEMRENFGADWCVWVDTIPAGRYADTNALFVPPAYCDFRITTQDAPYWSELVVDTILAKYLHVDPYLFTR
jgi:adenylylsulfate kinase